MSEEQLKVFQEAIQADAALQEKIKAADGPDAIVEIAKAAGFVISAEELGAAASVKMGELSDEELERVSGGVTPLVGVAVVAAACYFADSTCGGPNGEE